MIQTEKRRTCARCGAVGMTDKRVYVCQGCRTKAEGPFAGDPLTLREKQVASLVCKAKANKQIALDLSLSEGTVKEYIRHIFIKVGVSNRTGLAMLMLRSPEIVPLEKIL